MNHDSNSLDVEAVRKRIVGKGLGKKVLDYKPLEFEQTAVAKKVELDRETGKED